MASQVETPTETEASVPLRADRAWAWDLAWAVVIFGSALVLRIVYVAQLQDSPWFANHTMDPKFHHDWAVAFAQGESFTSGPYFRAPLYSWFLGTVYWVMGIGPWIPRIVQAALGSANCVLVFLIGRQVFSRTVGVIAGLAAASYWVFLYFDAELLSPVLITTLNLLLVWRLLCTQEKVGAWRWVVNGILLGLSAITRPDILLFTPVVVAWLVWLHWPRLKRVLGYIVSFGLGAAAVVAPVTIRNAVVGDDLVLIGTYGGVNLYIGNNPQSDGMSAVIPGDPVEWWPCYQAQVARAEADAGRTLKPSEVSQWYVDATWDYVRSNPGEALGRMLRKAAYFWTRWEIPNNQDIYFVTQAFTPITWFLPLGFWIVGPLGLLGLGLSLRQPRRLLPLWSIILVYNLVVALFFATARYRVPAVAVLMVLGAYALTWLIGRIRQQQVVPVGLGVLGLIVATLLVAPVPGDTEAVNVQGLRYAGYALIKEGKPEAAARMLTESMELATRTGQSIDPKAWSALGEVRMELQQPAQAEVCFRRCLEADADFPQARLNLALVLVQQEKFAQAAEQYRRLVQQHPDNPLLQAGLGGALLSSGQTKDGFEHLRAAVRLDPLRDDVLAELGGALIVTGRVDEGIEHLARAVALNPERIGRLMHAVDLLLQKQQHADALRVMRAGVEQAPNHTPLLIRLAQLLAGAPEAELRDPAAALRYARRAVQRTQQRDPLALYSLAMAQWAAGNIDDGSNAARRALKLAREQNQERLAEVLVRDLKRFQGVNTP